MQEFYEIHPFWLLLSHQLLISLINRVVAVFRYLARCQCNGLDFKPVGVEVKLTGVQLTTAHAPSGIDVISVDSTLSLLPFTGN